MTRRKDASPGDAAVVTGRDLPWMEADATSLMTDPISWMKSNLENPMVEHAFADEMVAGFWRRSEPTAIMIMSGWGRGRPGRCKVGVSGNTEVRRAAVLAADGTLYVRLGFDSWGTAAQTDEADRQKNYVQAEPAQGWKKELEPIPVGTACAEAVADG